MECSGVLPKSLQQDFLHHYSTNLERGTKESAVRTSGYGNISIGKDYSKVCNVILVLVLIVRPARVDQLLAEEF